VNDDADELLAQLRVDRAKAVGVGAALKVRKSPQQFVKLPMWWAEAVAAALRSPATMLVAELLYQHWKTKRTTFPLPNDRLQHLGVSRWVKYRNLQKLERGGLIRVERRPRKSPLVTLIGF
jgi:hypothetical protein